MQRAFFGVALCLTASFAAADMFKPSKADQVKLGQQASDQIRKKEKIVADSDQRVQLMRNITKKLLSTVDDSKEPWKYSFDLIDNKEVNAFALPGGPIFFYTGLVNRFKTEDEFAAVLAHELTHVRKEHWAYAYAESQKRNIGISLILILTKSSRTTWDIASIGNDLLFELPFSRKHETEADMLGLRMMVDAGYNPQGMVEVFKTLQAASKGKKPEEWLSTHPDDGKRIARIESEIKKLNRTFGDQKPLPWKPEQVSARSLRWNWP